MPSQNSQPQKIAREDVAGTVAAFKSALERAGKSIKTSYTYARHVELALTAGFAAGRGVAVQEYIDKLPDSARAIGTVAWRQFCAWAHDNGYAVASPGAIKHGPSAWQHDQPLLVAMLVSFWPATRPRRELPVQKWSEFTRGGWRTLPGNMGDPWSWPFYLPIEVIQAHAAWAWGWPLREPPLDAPIFAREPQSMVPLSIRELNTVCRSIGYDVNFLIENSLPMTGSLPDELAIKCEQHVAAEENAIRKLKMDPLDLPLLRKHLDAWPELVLRTPFDAGKGIVPKEPLQLKPARVQSRSSVVENDELLAFDSASAAAD